MVTIDGAERFVRDVLAEPGCSRVTDVIVVRGGDVLARHSSTGGLPRDLFSVTKTVLAVLVGFAVRDGLVDLDVPVARYTGLEGTGDQTLRHLLTMTRGAEVDGPFDLDLVAVTEPYWAAAFARSPQVAAPGERFVYDNGASQLVAEALHRAVPGGLRSFATRHLFSRLGAPDPEWMTDPAGVPSGAAHLRLTADALARLGTLLLDDSDGWAREMRTPSSSGGPPEGRPYGMGLWLEPDGAFFGAGWAGQLLWCRPSDRLVVVTLSDPGFDYGPPPTDHMPQGWVAPLEILRRWLSPRPAAADGSSARPR